jgi:type IV pilus assembly protein PilY1
MEKIIRILIFFLLTTYSANSKVPPPGTGKGDVPANIMIMLDNSGSMAWGLLEGPADVAVDSSGNIYVIEYAKHRIKQFNSSGTFIKNIGSYGSGCNQFNFPRQLTIYNNEIYVADTSNYRVVVIDTSGNCKRTLGFFDPPTGVAVSSSYMYVTTSANYIYTTSKTASGSIQGQAVNTQNSGTYLSSVNSVDVNNSGTKLITASPYNHQIVVWTLSAGIPTGAVVSVAGTSNSSRAVGTFLNAFDAVFDSSDNIYASDPTQTTIYTNSIMRVQKFTSSYSYSTKVGNTYNYAGPFYFPAGVGKDTNNNIYVADYANNRIFKFDTSLTLSNVWTGEGDSTISGAKNRLDVAKSVIKKIVSSSDLSTGANFGLMEWDGSRLIRVPISSSGGTTIYTDVDKINYSGGTFLYDALNLAKSYFAGTAGYSSPIIPGAQSCQLNYLIVVSDGEWDSPSNVNTLAAQLNAQYPPIKTFAVGLALGASSQNYTDLATNGGTKTPLYATNEAELLASLTDAISQAISSSLTFTNPAITTDLTADNYLYQATFKYSKNQQWEGSLKKYKLNYDGTIGSAIWDAATQLNNKSASNRNLWTVGLSTTGLNNFITNNRNEIKNLFNSTLVSTDAEVDKLISFVRGIDTYDQSPANSNGTNGNGNVSEERWKLSDIYHSQFSVVGPPSATLSANNIFDDATYRINNNYSYFASSNANRKEILLAGSNAGILHAFDTSSGEELWGFIPPSMLSKLPKIRSSTSNVTNAIYGIDGSPIVKDIYYGGAWRTIVLCGLGRGGNSYFALDITNPLLPSHLFTIENDDLNKKVKFWNSLGTVTEYSYTYGSVSDSTKDYSKLGETWSTPRIIRIKNSGVDKWVAVFGAGYNGRSNPNLGSAVFLMDLENNGNVYKKIDITDNSNTIVNSVPSDLGVVTSNTSSKANYYGAMVYAADLEGKVTRINLATDAGNSIISYQTVKLFDSESSITNGRYIYTGLETGVDNSGVLWLYFGTGDTQKIQDQNSEMQNRIYGIKDTAWPSITSAPSTGTVLNCRNTSVGCPLSTNLGWYTDLLNYQKLTAQPTINGSTVYFPIYEPPALTSICSPGKAILKLTNSICGNSIAADPDKYLGTGVLSKAVTSGSKLVIGISGTADVTQAKGYNKTDNVIIGDISGTTATADVTIEAWREN